VLVGRRHLHSAVLSSAGQHVLTVSSPSVPLSAGHLQLRCHNRHAKLLTDTIPITYVQNVQLSYLAELENTYA